jgi:bifunctional DNase/RNase
MTVSQLTVDPFTNMPILILKDAAGDEALPIWIGLLEASAIATELEKIALDRPMTHDLLKKVIGESGLKVACIEIRDVKDNTFYAAIRLVGPRGREIELDSRPSDAIALALRTGAPIRVAKKVLARTQKLDLSAPSAKGRHKVKVKNNQLRELLENLADEQFGKWKM